MSPVPASPFVRIIAAPSPIRRSASPRLRQPQTNGTVKSCLKTWFSSSAGVRTSDSSMKSTFSASSTRASARWPIRHLAITGIETASWISRILETGDIRATPPSRRMSAGTRSSAITAAAPAASAIFACSALTTSMMTPPLSISASPTFNRNASSRLMSVSPSTVDCRLSTLAQTTWRGQRRSRSRLHLSNRFREGRDARADVLALDPGHRQPHVAPILASRVEVLPRRDSDAARRGGLGHPPAGGPLRQMQPEERVRSGPAPPADLRQVLAQGLLGRGRAQRDLLRARLPQPCGRRSPAETPPPRPAAAPASRSPRPS